MLESAETDAYVSAISGFEFSVKHRKGKLERQLAPREWRARAFAAYSLRGSGSIGRCDPEDGSQASDELIEAIRCAS
jgi:hypothetical protein